MQGHDPARLLTSSVPLQESALNDFIPPKEDNFNCRNDDHQFLRKSHEQNSGVPAVKRAATSGTACDETVILPELAAGTLDGGGCSCVVELEKEFRHTCQHGAKEWFQLDNAGVACCDRQMRAIGREVSKGAQKEKNLV